jgi:C_GCAxxG_C_C family probable redox protein
VDPAVRARQLCLDEETAFGCAEATYAALQEHFGIPDTTNSTEAMALNGGIAYSGGTCGALTGAALALGRLAGIRLTARPLAKHAARALMQDIIADFTEDFGSTQCRDLTGFDLAADHDEFLASGIWETGCQDQIEFAISRIAPLTDLESWNSALIGVATDGSATGLPTDQNCGVVDAD